MDRNRLTVVITIGIAVFFLVLGLAPSWIIETPVSEIGPMRPTPPLATVTTPTVAAAQTQPPAPVPTATHVILRPQKPTSGIIDANKNDSFIDFPAENRPDLDPILVEPQPMPSAVPTAASLPVPPPTPPVSAAPVDTDGESHPVIEPVIVDIKRLDLIYLGFMVVGIVFKVAYDVLKETVGWRKSLATLLLALIVSPIVYVGVYQEFIRESLSLVGIGIAFQNGFFWQTVFNEVGRTNLNNIGGGGTQAATAPQPASD
jgi:hypothetical protein